MAERKVAERLFAQALTALEEGQTLDFGAVKLSQGGLAVGERLLRWDEIARIDEEQGQRIAIEKRGAWTTWAPLYVGAIRNKRLMMEIVGERRSRITRDVAHA